MTAGLTALRDPKGDDLANVVDWWGLIHDAPAVLSTKTGRLQLTAEVVCVDTDTLDPDARAAVPRPAGSGLAHARSGLGAGGRLVAYPGSRLPGDGVGRNGRPADGSARRSSAAPGL